MKTKAAKAPRANHEEYRKTDNAEYGLTAPRCDAKWSGKHAIPARGQRVRVNFNEFGCGTVLGYFVEHGWLGVYVECDKWPKWWTKQNADDPRQCMMAFGVEIEPIEMKGL
jgi:hypothetical protein